MDVTRPPALNESFNTTGQNPENIADALKSGLAEIVSALGGDTEVDSVKEVRMAYGDANSVLALNTVNFTEIFHGTNTPAADNSESYLYLTGLGGDSDNGGVQIAIGAYPSANDKIFYRRFNGGSWGAWKQIYGGIQAGIPTDLNSNLTWNSTPSTTVSSTTQAYVIKSGNVVTFRLRFKCLTAFNAGELTELCKMPWSNMGIGVVLRTDITTGGITYALLYNGGLCFGGGGGSISANDAFDAWGTYLTND